MVPEWFRITVGEWHIGEYDSLIRRVADDLCRLTAMSLDSGALYCPYDGGADLFFANADDRTA